ncbi:LptA/OstA family protein [Sphingomicrobium sp. XHP0239]|uniref:LptA/OstA family protein n=1 Tax=Sphingomicrobium maritimum TaxID=3133972 RepID=UPI0031CC710E
MRARPIIAILLLLGLAGTASAQQSSGQNSILAGHDTGADVFFDADRLELLDREDRVLLVGNVVARQAGLTLRTSRLRVAYADTGGIDISRLDASGGVTLTSASETARGDYAVYDIDDGLITVVGDVRLQQGSNELVGERLTIDLDSGRAVIDGGPRGIDQSGGRVSGRFTVPERD